MTEAMNQHLFCLMGNSADPPNMPPETWGSLPHMEDAACMCCLGRCLKCQMQHACQNAAAFGLTLTELILSSLPPALLHMEDNAHDAVACADAYQYSHEVMAMAVGYGPLMKTPLNTLSPKWRPRGFWPLPQHTRMPTLPLCN